MTSPHHLTTDLNGVTVLGTGRMGTAIAAALLGAGRQVTVWNRTTAKAEDLVAKGASRADSAADAVAASPLVIVSLFDYDSVREVLDQTKDLLSGRTVVNLTTGTPQDARDLAGWLTEQGTHYLDGAMMAVPETVATPDAFFVYSGSRDVFDAHEVTLGTVAASHYLGTDPGVASFYDAGLLGTMYGALIGFLHSVALLDTVGISPTQFAPRAARWLEGMIPFLAVQAGEIESGDYANGASTIDINQHAVRNIVDLSRAQGVDPEIHTALAALLDRRAADGGGADSFSSLFELLKPKPAASETKEPTQGLLGRRPSR